MQSPDNARLAKALDALNTPAYSIFLHMQRAAQAYMELTNAATGEAAAAALKEMRAATADCEALVRKTLYEAGVPDVLILNVNKAAAAKWNLDVYSGLHANAMHWLQRYIHAPSTEAKTRQLTALYYLVKDMAECSRHLKADKLRVNL